MFFSNFLNLEHFLKKTDGLSKPHPDGFGKPTGLAPVFTGFVNYGGIRTSCQKNNRITKILLSMIKNFKITPASRIVCTNIMISKNI
jgi:hypothetical protein